MKLKADINLYNAGDRAAEMRLASFIHNCENRLDLDGLRSLGALEGKLGSFLVSATKKVINKIEKRSRDKKSKELVNDKINDIEKLGFNNDPLARSSDWVPILKKLAVQRHLINKDQEGYNLDFKIRQMINKAASLGIKI